MVSLLRLDSINRSSCMEEQAPSDTTYISEREQIDKPTHLLKASQFPSTRPPPTADGNGDATAAQQQAPAPLSHLAAGASKDPATSLYTIPVRDGANHVIDLAGPLLWSTCTADHLLAKISCQDPACKLANAYRAPGCHEADQPCVSQTQCTAYPYNPVTGQCAAASLVHTRLIANTTDGRNPLSQVSVRAVAACAPRTLLLCLPRSGGGEGVAVFGGGPLFLLPESAVGDLTSALAFTALRRRKDNPLYYIPVQGVAVNQARVPLPPSALAAGGVVLCTRVPYTLLRPDVYRPVAQAFDRALARNDAKVPAVAPFELCYRSSMLGNTRLGYAVPDIALLLEGGKSWTFIGSSSMVDVNGQTTCLAFVEMKGVKARDPAAAAVVVGGFQMENHLLQFDLEKKQLGFAKVPFFTACSNFNFTKTQ